MNFHDFGRFIQKTRRKRLFPSSRWQRADEQQVTVAIADLKAGKSRVVFPVGVRVALLSEGVPSDG